MTTRDIDTMLQRQQHMQREKLLQNEHKGTWRGEPLTALLFRLYEEADELKAEVMRLMEMQHNGSRALLPGQCRRITEEAADVANFAGFIVDLLWGQHALDDICKALEHYFDHEKDAPFERIDLMTLTADDKGGVDIVATAGDITVEANITARAIETGHITTSLRRLARMLRGES